MSAATAQGGFFSISGRQWLIVLMVQLSNMLFGMTITLANLVLPQIRGTFSATQDEISWVITLNLVATAIATPMTGWLSSRLGWRNLMFFTVLGFTVSSFLCGLANSLETLILARVAQGFFGGPIMPMGQAVLLATFPPHLQPAALMMWGVGAVFGPVVGPILGGHCDRSLQLARRLLHDRAAGHRRAGLHLVCAGRAQQAQRRKLRLDRFHSSVGRHRRRAADLRSRPAPGLVRLEGDHAVRVCRRARLLDLPRALPDGRSTLPEPAPVAGPQLCRRHPHRLCHGHAELHQPGAVSQLAA